MRGMAGAVPISFTRVCANHASALDLDVDSLRLSARDLKFSKYFIFFFVFSFLFPFFFVFFCLVFVLFLFCSGDIVGPLSMFL